MKDHFRNCNYLNWVGNGFCDDPVNTKECQFDGGDCCPINTSDTSWNKYCNDCICKQI